MLDGIRLSKHQLAVAAIGQKKNRPENEFQSVQVEAQELGNSC